MPIIEIDGVGRVEVGDEFLKMDPSAQDAFIGTITQSAKSGAKSSDDPVAPGATNRGKSSLPMFAQSAPEQFADLAKSGGVGLTKGATGIMGTAGALGQLWDNAPAWVADKAVRGLERLGAVNAGTADKLAASVEEDRRAWLSPAEYEGRVNKIAGIPFATPKGFDAIVQSAAGPYYEPKTRLGKYAETVGEFLPGSAIGPGGLSRLMPNSVKYGVMPGIASEAAGQATEGTALEPWARAAAAIGTAGGAAYASAPAYAERMAGRAVNGVSEPQFAQAQALMRDAEARGIRLTVDEAIQHVTGGATRAGDLRRVVENTVEGSQRFGPVMAERPGQVRAATDAALDQITARSAQPSYIGPQMQAAGQKVLDKTRQGINKVADPYYTTARQTTGEIDVSNVLSHIDDTIAPLAGQPGSTIEKELSRYRDLISGEFAKAGKAAERVPITDKSGRIIRYEMKAAVPDTPRGTASALERLELVRTEIGDAITAAKAAGENNRARLLTGIQERLTRTMDAASSDFAKGRSIVEEGRKRVLSPLEAGPAGQIAATDDFVAQGGALMGNRPSAGEVSRAASGLMRENPQATKELVREQLGRTADKTVAGLDSAGRPDQFGAAKFARELRGNAREAANIDAAIRAAAGDATAENVSRLVDVLQATGQRQRPGSLTAFNKEALDDMKRGGVESLLQALTKPLQTGKDAIARRRLGRQSENLAEALLAGPEGVGRLREIAREGSGARNTLLRVLMGGGTALSHKRD